MRVLYVDIDTLRADHLGCYGYHRDTSPNIDALADESARFDNCYVSDAPCLPSRAESGGEEPYLAGKINTATVKGIQSTQVIATVKHFAATNHQEDRKSTNHTIDGRTLREFYGMPFRYAVQQGSVWSVMNAYNWINGQPSSANHKLLTQILRDEWGYQYYVISDWDSIYTGAANAINAGCDLEMPGHTNNIYRGELPGALDDGTVSMDTLDNAVRRVLRTKQVAGIIGEGAYPQGDPSDVNSPEHQALALEVAQKSIILLKNEGNLLPLAPNSLNTIALIGPNANVAQMDGKGSSVVKPFYMIIPREGIQDRAPDVTINYVRGCDINSSKNDDFAAAIDAANAPGVDVVIFVGGLDATQEGENVDRVGGECPITRDAARACQSTGWHRQTPSRSDRKWWDHGSGELHRQYRCIALCLLPWAGRGQCHCRRVVRERESGWQAAGVDAGQQLRVARVGRSRLYGRPS